MTGMWWICGVAALVSLGLAGCRDETSAPAEQAATGGSSGAGVGGQSSGPSGEAGSDAGSGGTSSTGSRRIADQVTVSVSGRRILVNGEPIHLRGVCWHPVPRGGVNEDVDFAGFADIDIPLMERIGINVVRTYTPITNRDVLDRLQDAGIYVINTVYAWGGAPADSVIAPVEAVRDHPAVLLWAIGNEWNYNGLYVGLSQEESIQRLQEVIGHLRATDATRPIATVYGELPSSDVVAALPEVDVWGLNVYRNIGFGDLFDAWRELDERPLFLAEYGADAWNSTTDSYDPESQAHAVSVLTELIVANSVALGDGVVSGGTLFAWADEWWKAGNPDAHDVGGEAPGGGPYPDNTFNEEWWGIVDVDRNPRPAYDVLGAIYTRLGPTPGTVPDGDGSE